MMKKFAAGAVAAALLLGLCGSCGSAEEVSSVPAADAEPQISQMRSICELAVMECYYHNVAKYKEEDAEGVWLWKKDKHFWVEYSGVVELGVDASQVKMTLEDDKVTVTLPEVRVLGCVVDSSSLTKDSFIVAQNSAAVTAEDEQAAFKEAQARMEESAANDHALLASAEERVKMLLTKYVETIGEAVDKQYAISFKELGAAESAADSESSADSGASAESKSGQSE